MSKIAIIGAGRIGTHLAYSLAAFGKVSEIRLANRNRNRLNAGLSSMRAASHALRSPTLFAPFSRNEVADLDLIIVCAKDIYDPRHLEATGAFPSWVPKNLRYVGLPHDLPILYEIGRSLRDYDGTVAVITNPVEVTSHFMAKWLPKARVYGLGASVDSNRIAFVASGALGCSIDPDACLVLGEHGNKLTSVSEFWKKEARLWRIPATDRAKLLHDAAMIGLKIVRGIGFTLHDCIPAFQSDIEWLLGKNKGSRSFAVEQSPNCFISRPISRDNAGITQVFDNFTKEEQMFLECNQTRLERLIRRIQNAGAVR